MDYKRVDASEILPQIKKYYFTLVGEHNREAKFMKKYNLPYTKELVSDIKGRFRRMKELEKFIEDAYSNGFVVVNENGEIENIEDAFNLEKIAN